jgi:thiamine-monophosphate kinase
MPHQTGEFERIATFFAPLTENMPGALGLRDDAAVLDLSPGCDLVVTTDTVVETVHFVGDEPADLVARKLLRVNLSDLASMGARPYAYTLNVAFPDKIDDAWLAGFVAGLASDQEEFGIALAGGDSVSTVGPVTLTITAFGEVASGTALRRTTAQAGDLVYVTGTIGDGALGLQVLGGGIIGLGAAFEDALVTRYRLPQPRLGVGRAISGIASAATDVSDGLVADLGHIADGSELAAVIDAEKVPLSDAARAAVSSDPMRLETILTGGDDYELVFAVPPTEVDRLDAIASEPAVALTPIGTFEPGTGVRVRGTGGSDLDFQQAGYSHR